MFSEIFRFEVRYQLRQPLFYICTAIFFLLTFGAVTTDSVTIGGAIGNVNRNAPFVIMQILLMMSTLGVFTTTAFVASSIHRDVEYNTQSLFFSTPISKGAYLLGRFGGSFVAAFAVFLGVSVAIVFGSFMPWLEPDRIGPFSWKPYVFSLFVLVLPNLFLTGGIFYSLAARTRSMLYTYTGVILFFVGYAVSGRLMRDLKNEFIAGLLDPFGFRAFFLSTKYWTVFEKNTKLLPLESTFLYNRILWLSVAVCVLALTYWRYRFTLAAPGRSKTRELEDHAPAAALETPAVMKLVTQDFSSRGALRQYLYQTRLEFLTILKGVPFLIMLFMGILNIVGNSVSIGEFYGTPVYPVTNLMLDIISGAYELFLFLILLFYSSELVWKERSLNLHGVYDALPVRTWTLWASKFTALAWILLVVLAAGMLTAMGIQVYHGYFHFELPLYFKSLLLITGIPFLLIAALSFFLQVITNNKYLGFLLMVLYMVSLGVLPALHWEHNLYQYAKTPSAPYSDMNGYGHFVAPLFWFTLYWTLAAAALLTISHLFWVRGRETGLRWRMALARRKLTLRSVSLLVCLLAGFALTGGFIYYNTNVLNRYETEDSIEKKQAEYEKKYKQYENASLPRITDVRTDVDIFPAERALSIRGSYILKNKSSQTQQTVHLTLDPKVKIEAVRAPGRLEMADRDLGYFIYRLEKPLDPGQSVEFGFTLSVSNPGFVNNRSNTRVVHNGTFFDNADYFPHMGYSHWSELKDSNKRKKYGLQPVQRFPKIDDQAARQNTYVTSDSDWVNFESTVSTSPDQIAIAPGYLQRQWTENGRRYFHYKMDAPILNFWSFLSARYAVKRDRWNDVAIEIYYHPAHPYNVDRMIYAIKKSLDYFTANFGPYQHKQVRIIEFPRYEAFAQSFPNTIPYSESIGFIARIEAPEDIDYVFYVTAHEVAHQWWAHQVIGANVQGATMLSESMAQYSALMVMEKEYGPMKMRKFLKYELDRYLRGRGGELVAELPLLLVENQPYIHYYKGSVVMYALRDYVGEQRLNEALASYVRAVAFQEPPYTTTMDWLSYVKPAVPEAYRAVIKDMFETITLYETKTTEVNAVKRADGKYEVKITVECKKFRADEKGQETEVPIDDWIDVGVLGEKEKDGAEKVLVLEKKHITGAGAQFDFVVSEQPRKAGIDPLSKLVDRNPEDNTKDFDSHPVD